MYTFYAGGAFWSMNAVRCIIDFHFAGDKCKILPWNLYLPRRVFTRYSYSFLCIIFVYLMWTFPEENEFYLKILLYSDELQRQASLTFHFNNLAADIILCVCVSVCLCMCVFVHVHVCLCL